MRSDSRPGYLRTASRNNYVRDNSKFRRGSNIRSRSLHGGKFTGPRNTSKKGVRNPSKTPERQKSELFKNVGTLEKYMKEMLKGKLINNHFVEEEVIVDVKYMNARAPRMMLIDSGAPKSVVSKEWIEGYLKDMKVDESEIEKKSCCRRFRMGETTYLSEVEIRFPIVLKTDNGDYMKREVTAYIIDADRGNFLLGRETIKEGKLRIDHEEDKLELKEKGKKVELIESKGGHSVVNLELVGKWEDSEAIYLVEKEDEVKSDKAIKKIHKTLNHKSREKFYMLIEMEENWMRRQRRKLI